MVQRFHGEGGHFFCSWTPYMKSQASLTFPFWSPLPLPPPPRRDPSHCREVLIHIQLYKHWKLCIVAVVRRSTEFSNYTDVSKWTLQSSIQTRYFSHRKTTGKERHNTLTVAEMGSLVPGIKKCKLTVPDWITLSLVPASVSIDTIIKSDN